MPSTVPDSFLHVVAGVIRNEDGEVLLSRRQAGRHQAGKWEFPGGKCETGESAEQALARELQEELGITARALMPRIRVPWRYPDVAVFLDVYDVIEYDGVPQGQEGQALSWSLIGNLDEYDYPAANLPVLTSLRLPDRYAISNATGLGQQRFLELLEQQLDRGLKLVQLREPGMDGAQYRQLAEQSVTLAHRHDARILLNTPDVSLVFDTGADGLHLKSKTLMSLDSRPLPDTYMVAASCHAPEQIRHAEKIDASFFVLSPVKRTRSHPEVEPIGWKGFADIVSLSHLPAYALGGMTPKDIASARRAGGQGVALLGAAWG